MVDVLITDLVKFFDVIAQDIHPIVGARVGLGEADQRATHTEWFSYTVPLGPCQLSTLTQLLGTPEGSYGGSPVPALHGHFGPPKVKNCMSMPCSAPFIHVSHYWWKQLFLALVWILTGPRQGYRLQNSYFCFPVGIYCHKMSTHIPHSGLHEITEVAITATIAKMLENCINSISARLVVPDTNPMKSGRQKFFRIKVPPKKAKDSSFFTHEKRGRGYVLTPPSPPQQLPKVGVEWGRGV